MARVCQGEDEISPQTPQLPRCAARSQARHLGKNPSQAVEIQPILGKEAIAKDS